MGISFHFDRTRADEKTEAVAPVFSDVGVLLINKYID